jgi:DNA ligase-1
MDFKIIRAFVEEMQATSSTNDKKEILKKYDSPELRRLFEYVYSPFKKYYVTSDNLKKYGELSFDNYDDRLFQLLDDLNDRRITGHSAIECVNGFINRNKEYSEIIYQIIDRNLKTRATDTLINSVMPGTVPTFDVALAEKFATGENKVDFDSGDWWFSRKLDGVRCICIIDAAGEIRFFSRAGNEFLTLSVLGEDIKRLGLKSKVLDGEVCIMREDGLEDFQGIIKEIGRKNHTIETPKYWVFDFLELDEFEQKRGDVSFVARQIILNGIVEGLTYAEPLPQFQITSRAEFDKMSADAVEMGYEGGMIRKNVGYEGKRSKNLLKVKVMQDEEYVVIDAEYSTMRIIHKGSEIEEEMLSNIVIEHRGNKVDVGSGFNLEQRRHYFQHPEEIIGKTITVQYFGESQDQHGKYSLRFPVFKGIYGEKRDV